MATQSGYLHVNRRRITLVEGQQTIDTGIEIPEGNYAPDPNLDGADPVPPAAGTPSRVMVIPHPPFTNWRGVVNGEPTVNPATGRVDVDFFVPDGAGGEVVVTFWNPHSHIGPVSADTYFSDTLDCEDCEFVDIESNASVQA